MPGIRPQEAPLSIAEGPARFADTLARQGLELCRERTHTFQVNVGLLCNQVCRHCHLEAGPTRPEVMSPDTMDEVVAFAARGGFETVDVTGGAPEMVPGLPGLIERLAPLVKRLMLRSNLTAIGDAERRHLIDLCRAHRVVIVASLPSTNLAQTEAQRGQGVWERSLTALRLLNEAGYGREGTGLELDLASSPAGAFLPPSQSQLEKKFRHDLERRRGLVFNHLFAFANAPLGRFRGWLEKSGNLEAYTQKLAESFNPCTVGGLMCRTLVSCAWDGTLYDCDFNQAAGIPLGSRRIHIAELDSPPAQGSPIATGEHCYACTAGAGFT